MPVIFRMSQQKPASGHGQAGQHAETALDPNADEWQYYMQGSARMTVFNTGPHAKRVACEILDRIVIGSPAVTATSVPF